MPTGPDGVEIVVVPQDGHPAPGTPPPAPNSQPANGPQTVHHMTPAAIKKLKDEQRRKGAEASFKAQEDDAKSRGFASYKDMLAYYDTLRGNPPPGTPPKKPHQNAGNGPSSVFRERDGVETPTDPPNEPHTRTSPRNEGEVRRLTKQLEQERRGRVDESRRAKRLQGELDAAQARNVMEKSAVMCGVKDVDYAIHLLQKHLDGKTPEEMEKFDHAAFFEGLRKTHSHLFGELVTPIHTGAPGGGNTPPPPAPGDASRRNADQGKTNVSEKNADGTYKVKDHEFRAILARRGFDPNMV